VWDDDMILAVTERGSSSTSSVERAHGDAAALPGDSDPTEIESEEYAKLIAEQGVEGEVAEAEAEMPEDSSEPAQEEKAEVKADVAPATTTASIAEVGADATATTGDRDGDGDGTAAPISKHADSFRVPTETTGFHMQNYASVSPSKDKVFDGSARWKQEAVVRLQRQSLALSQSESAADLRAPLRSPCRPLALALEGLVDTRPRNKPFHKCRRNHDDNPLFAIALVLREARGKTSSATLHAAVNTLKALARRLGGTQLKAGAEVMLMFDGLWPDPKVINALQKRLQSENDWFFVSRTRHGDVKQLNKLIRGSRARNMLVLRQEDWVATGGAAGGAAAAVDELVKWVNAGRRAMDAHPNLVLLSASSGGGGEGGGGGSSGGGSGGGGGGSGSDGGSAHAVDWSATVTHTPLLVRRVPVVNLGGLEEWGSCADEVLSARVAGELAVRAWRGGLQAGRLAAGPGVATVLPEHRTRVTKAGGAWPFVVPGLTREEMNAAETHVVAARAGAWMTFVAPTVAGNCAPPDVDAHGRAPSSTASCGRAPSYPVATLVMQYFRRPAIVNELLTSLKTLSLPMEIIVNDDSRSEVAAFSTHSKGPAHYDWYLAMLNDVHEIRGYNRLALMASAELIVMVQDDDSSPRGDGWLRQALILFNAYPSLGMLGGYRGRIDNGRQQIKEQKQNNGEKYGAHPERDTAGRTKHLRLKDMRAGVPLMWMYKVNLAPLLIPRSLFAEVGGFNLNFSCAGQPGIGLDFELSIRLWKLGRRVGLYDPKFKHGIGNSKSSGTHSGAARRSRNANEKRNNMMLYTMYPGFHHKAGAATCMQLNKQGIKEKLLSSGNWYSKGKRSGRKTS
jgi:GT2 family glycosyltransferase